MFITDALADTATPSTAQSLMSALPMIAILIVFMYFMVIRPQTKRSKDQKNLINNLQKGDEVITVGGILGKIENITDGFVLINIAHNTSIKIQKSSIASLVPPGTIKSE